MQHYNPLTAITLSVNENDKTDDLAKLGALIPQDEIPVTH